MKDVLDCNHLAHRDYWHTLPDGNASKPVLGPLFRFSKTSRVLQQGAPDLKPVSMSIKESHDK
jgi:crotonobetainyl-CoA:carnitine CoA-transferase CaiB-like acyl-CoA transferase